MSKSKANRVKFGAAEGPLRASRVLVNPNDHDFGGKQLNCLLVIDDEKGTFTPANAYGSGAKGENGLGRNFEAQVHPLPEPGSDKWKEWSKKGYTEGKVSDWDVLFAIKAPKVKESKVEQPAR